MEQGDLHPLTKGNLIRATGAHISIIGHITEEELLRQLTATEQRNGFANRFLWLLVKRSKYLARNKGIPDAELAPLAERLRQAYPFAKGVKEIDRDDEAEVLWEKVYPELSEGKPGLYGAVTGRAEAQVMRLACLYALLDRSELIHPVHLKAALALWDYTDVSARLIFGDRQGDPLADAIDSTLLHATRRRS